VDVDLVPAVALAMPGRAGARCTTPEREYDRDPEQRDPTRSRVTS
jgi:hypothetical protein